MTDSPETIKKWVQKAREIGLRTQADYERLVSRRKADPLTQGVSSLMPPPPKLPEAPTAPTKTGAHSSDDGFNKNINLLRTKKVTAAEFDAHYGAGSAARVLGGSSNAQPPFVEGQ